MSNIKKAYTSIGQFHVHI